MNSYTKNLLLPAPPPEASAGARTSIKFIDTSPDSGGTARGAFSIAASRRAAQARLPRSLRGKGYPSDRKQNYYLIKKTKNNDRARLCQRSQISDGDANGIAWKSSAVTLTGKVDLNSSVRRLNKAFDIALETRVCKVLFNSLGVTGTRSTLERYGLGSKVAAHVSQLGTNPNIAFVGVLPTSTGFAVRVAQTRDVAVELFRDIPAALALLGRWPVPEKPGGVSP